MKFSLRTVGPFEENSYLVVDETTNRGVLIDPGDNPDEIVAMVRESGATLDAIWLTHGHLDHIGAVAGVRRQWKVPVHLHPNDLPLYERATTQAAVYGLPFDQPENPARLATPIALVPPCMPMIIKRAAGAISRMWSSRYFAPMLSKITSTPRSVISRTAAGQSPR